MFLAGDVMTGRGIDQVLPHPGDPRIHEEFMTSAEGYVHLAERRSGPLPRPVPYAHVWGDLRDELVRRRCDLRLINLETAITRDGVPAPKGINYRMHPDNIGVLTLAGIDGCILANNHVMDWGRAGLVDTLDALGDAGIGTVGAGRNSQHAAAPLVVDCAGRGRVITVAFGAETSGVPRDWAAGDTLPGIEVLPRDPEETVARVSDRVAPLRRPGDVLIVSIHWGGNWGFEVPDDQRALAHALIDHAVTDVVFGHSSHHPKGIEIYRGKLILYGAGDLINDYEGIEGYEQFRGDLALAYFAEVNAGDGRLAGLDMVPYRRRGFRLCRAKGEAAAWLADAIGRRSVVPTPGLTRSPDDVLRIGRAPGAGSARSVESR